MRSTPVLLCGILLYCLLPAKTQAQKSARYYERHPAWIAMMDDSTTNYFEAVKAFDLYWKDKERPLEEEELMENGGANTVEKVGESKRDKKEEHEHLAWKNDEEHMQMAFYYKRFMDWKLEAEAFVQSNGHVLTLYERRMIWEKDHGKQEGK